MFSSLGVSGKGVAFTIIEIMLLRSYMAKTIMVLLGKRNNYFIPAFLSQGGNCLGIKFTGSSFFASRRYIRQAGILRLLGFIDPFA